MLLKGEERGGVCPKLQIILVDNFLFIDQGPTVLDEVSFSKNNNK